ncbi:hypothetical protein FF1_008930 [Malus domestica]
MATGGGSQVVKVKRETIEACLKCGLCNKVSEEATTISFCLHTFCRKCIFQKLSEEEYDQCPVCDTHLGNLPVTTLKLPPSSTMLPTLTGPCSINSPASAVAPFLLKLKLTMLKQLRSSQDASRPDLSLPFSTSSQDWFTHHTPPQHTDLDKRPRLSDDDDDRADGEGGGRLRYSMEDLQFGAPPQCGGTSIYMGAHKDDWIITLAQFAVDQPNHKEHETRGLLHGKQACLVPYSSKASFLITEIMHKTSVVRRLDDPFDFGVGEVICSELRDWNPGCVV